MGPEVAGANGSPALLGGDAGFPAGGAFAEEVAVGQGEKAADLRGAVELVGSRGAEGAESGAGDGEVLAEFAGDSEAGVEDLLGDKWKRAGGWQPLLAVEVVEPVDTA